MRCPTALVTLAAMLLAAPAIAQDSPYLDDRSSAKTIVTSLYNAIDRHEYLRAWSYFGDDKPVASYAEFVAGYGATAQTRLRFGDPLEEGAAGSLYATIPLALEAVSPDGTTQIFGGCYTTRLLQPTAQQEPPFRPLHIVKGRLEPRKGALQDALPATCDSDARPTF